MKESFELGIGVTYMRVAATWGGRQDVSKFLEQLDEDGKAALLELIAAAALDDGEISDEEQEYLDRRSEEAGASAVKAALDTVRAALPFADLAAHEAFIAQRGDRLPGDYARRHAFIVCLAILDDVRAPDIPAKATLYGAALRVPESERVFHQIGVGFFGGGRDD